ncbi:hypothetical protein AHiyo4_43340 [Arthrobacter sp. Hiyo4]|nr:hypothetical protein AHiyo4_43340 [Arthrobacter sp. Hiyo4]
MDLVGAEVTDLSGQERSQATVADSHPAAAGHQHAGVFADVEQRSVAVGVNFPVRRLKGDQAAVVPYTPAKVVLNRSIMRLPGSPASATSEPGHRR